MDTEKLFRILKDFLKDEETLGLQAKIEAIKSSLGSNNLDGLNNATTQINALIEEVRTASVSYTFSQTEEKILQKLGGVTFFGFGLINELQSILRSNNFDMLSRLNTFWQSRNDFIIRTQRLASAFADNSISEYRPNDSEIAIILPNALEDAVSVSKKIREFQLLIERIQELVGTQERGVKINRVSTGSLEFFTSQPVEVVMVVTTILANISQIWDKIAHFKKKISETSDDTHLSPKAKKEIKKTINDSIAEVKKEIEEKIPEELIAKYAAEQIDTARKNEIRNDLRVRVKAVFAWFELDVQLDVIPVRAAPLPETTEQQNQQQQAVVTEMRKLNQTLRDFYQLPANERKLPFQLGNGTEAPEVEAEEVVTEVENTGV